MPNIATKPYDVTLAAQDDIDTATAAIPDEGAADEWVDDLHEAFERLALIPGRGHGRSDLTKKDVLFWTFKDRWAVIYKKAPAPAPRILIVRLIPWATITPELWLGPDL